MKVFFCFAVLSTAVSAISVTYANASLATRADETEDLSFSSGTGTSASLVDSPACNSSNPDLDPLQYYRVRVPRAVSTATSVAVIVSIGSTFNPQEEMTFCFSTTGDTTDNCETQVTPTTSFLCGKTDETIITASTTSGVSGWQADGADMGLTTTMCLDGSATLGGSEDESVLPFEGSGCTTAATGTSVTSVGFLYTCPTMSSFTTTSSYAYITLALGVTPTIVPIVFDCTYSEHQIFCVNLRWCAPPSPQAWAGCRITADNAQVLADGCTGSNSSIPCTVEYSSQCSTSSSLCNAYETFNALYTVCASSDSQLDAFIQNLQDGDYSSVVTGRAGGAKPTRRNGGRAEVATGTPAWAEYCTFNLETATTCTDYVAGCTDPVTGSQNAACAASAPPTTSGNVWLQSDCMTKTDLETTTFSYGGVSAVTDLSYTSNCIGDTRRRRQGQATWIGATTVCDGIDVVANPASKKACCVAFAESMLCDVGFTLDFTTTVVASCPGVTFTTSDYSAIKCNESAKGLLGLLGLLALIPLLILLILCIVIICMVMKKRKRERDEEPLPTYDPQQESCAAPPPVYTDIHHVVHDPIDAGYSDYGHGSGADVHPPPPPNSSYPY